MPSAESALPRLERRTMLLLFLILAAAITVRLICFIGYQGHDDRNYIAYGYLYASGASIPAANLLDPWMSRWGVWLPIAAEIRYLGTGEHALALYSMLCSVGSVLVTFYLAALFFDVRIALLSAALMTVFPLEVLYGTRMFGDTPIGFWSLVAFALLAHGSLRKTGNAPLFCLAGIAVGVGWTIKETAVIAALPVLFVPYRNRTQLVKGLVWTGVGLALAMCGELLFWRVVTGDALYRVHCIQASKKWIVDGTPAQRMFGILPHPVPDQINRSSNTVLDVILMYALNEEYGALYYFVWPIAAWALLRRHDRARPAAIFLFAIGGLLAFFPFHFPRFTVARDPRFTMPMSAAAIGLFVWWASRFQRKVQWLLLGGMAATWLPCLYVGYVSSSMDVQRQLTAFARDHGERMWLSNKLAADVLVLSRFDAKIAVGVHWIEEEYEPKLGPLQNASIRCLRPDAPAVNKAVEIPDGYVGVERAGEARVPREWTRVETIRPEVPGLVRTAQSVLRGVGVPPDLVARLAPNRGAEIQIFHVNRQSAGAIRRPNP